MMLYLNRKKSRIANVFAMLVMCTVVTGSGTALLGQQTSNGQAQQKNPLDPFGRQTAQQPSYQAQQDFYQKAYQQIQNADPFTQKGEYERALQYYQALLATQQAEISPYWIGVQCEPVDPQGVPIESDQPHIGKLFYHGGLNINSVTTDSPADQAGLKSGDTIVKFNGQQVDDIATLNQAIRQAEESSCEVIVIRERELLTLNVTPAKRPEEPSPSAKPAYDAWIRYWIDQQTGDGRATGYYGNLLSGIDHMNLPDDVELSIKKQGSQPAKVMLSRGEEQWEISGGKIDELPADLQSYLWGMYGLSNAHSYPNYYQYFPVPHYLKGLAYQPSVDKYSSPYLSQEQDNVMQRIDELAKQLEALRESVEKINKD